MVTFVKTMSIVGNGKNDDPTICLELQLQLEWFQLLEGYDVRKHVLLGML
jgi:hypothetical protein